MEKEYLGLGVVFNALDKGFKKSVEGIRNALSGVNDAMVQATKAAGGGLFDKVGEGLKMLSLSQIGSTLSDIKEGMQGTGHGINDLAKELDFTRAKMTAALDPKIASKFEGQMMGLVSTMGVTADQAGVISDNLLNSGVGVDKLGSTLPMIGTLVGKLGMDAGAVSTMFGQMQGYLQMSSRQATGFTKEIFKLQKEFKLTNLMESLPEITNNVYENMLKLGKNSPIMAMRIAHDVATMSAAFQKMGMSQQKATGVATSFNDKMTEIQRSFQDVQGGLTDAMGPIEDLFNAFGSGGIDATKLVNEIKNGAKPSDMMKEMQQMVSKLDDTNRNNVMVRIRKMWGDDIANMIGPLHQSFDKVNKDAAQQSKKIGTAEDAFKQFTGQLDGTLTVTEKIQKATHEMRDAITSLANKKDLMTWMVADTNAMRDFTNEVASGTGWLGKLWKAVDLFKVGGLAAFFPSLAKLSPVLHVFSEMIFPLTAMWGLLKLVGAPLKWIGTFFTTLLKPIGLLADLWGEFSAAAGLFFGEVAGGAGVLESFAAVLGVVTNPIGWLIGAVVAIGAGVAAAAYYWDDLTETVSHFSKHGGMAMKWFGKTVGKVWGGLVSVAGGAWDLIVGGAKYVVTAVVNTFKFLFTAWKVQWDIAAHIVGAVVEGIADLWTSNRDSLLDTWNGLVDGFKSILTSVANLAGGAMDKITSVLAPVGKAIYGALKPVMDKIKSIFGPVADAVGGMFGSIWDPMVKGFNRAKDFITKGIASMFDMLPDWLKTDLGQLASSFKKIFVHDNSAGQNMASAAQAVAQSPSTEGTVATPTKSQSGAPRNSNMSGLDLTPTAVPKVDDKNTQAMLQMLAETKDAIVKAIAQGGNVQVILQGDARKFLHVVNQNARDNAGAAGLNSSVGG